MEIRNMKCPNCDATLTFEDSVSILTCNYCGSTIMIDDKAAEADRELIARSQARQRDAEIETERARNLSEIDEKEKIIDALTQNPSATLGIVKTVLDIIDDIT